MRLVFRIDSNHISLLPAGVAVCVAFALSSMPAGAADVYAQASFADATNVTTATSAQQTTEVAADETSNATADTTTGVDIANGVDSTGPQFTNVPADSAAMSDFALDDQVLARQRGGAAARRRGGHGDGRGDAAADARLGRDAVGRNRAAVAAAHSHRCRAHRARERSELPAEVTQQHDVARKRDQCRLFRTPNWIVGDIQNDRFMGDAVPPRNGCR